MAAGIYMNDGQGRDAFSTRHRKMVGRRPLKKIESVDFVNMPRFEVRRHRNVGRGVVDYAKTVFSSRNLPVFNSSRNRKPWLAIVLAKGDALSLKIGFTFPPRFSIKLVKTIDGHMERGNAYQLQDFRSQSSLAFCRGFGQFPSS